MKERGLFDEQERLNVLSKLGDNLKYTFLKMQQLRECQFSKTVAFVRGTRTRQ